jgi:hypothetical protein
VARTPPGRAAAHLCYYDMFQECIKVVLISYKMDTSRLEYPYIAPNRRLYTDSAGISSTQLTLLLSKHASQHTDKAWAEFVQLLDLRLLRLSSFPPELLCCLCALLPLRLYWIRNVFVVDVFFDLRVSAVVVEFKVFEIELRFVLANDSTHGRGFTYFVQPKVARLESGHTAHHAVGFIASTRHLLPSLVGMPLLPCCLPLD